MAIFYVVEDAGGEVIGAHVKLKEAHEQGKTECGESDYSIDRIEMDVSTENVRKLLSGQGGYATTTTRIVEAEAF